MKRKFAGVVVVVALALASAAFVAHDLYHPYRGFAGNVIIEISPGMGARPISALLVERGVLAHRIPFLIRYAIGRARNRLKAGEYLFDRPLRPIDVYRILIRGDVYLHPVLIPEGSDRFDMARIFDERLAIDPAVFLRTTEQTALIRDLDPQAPSLEGYLFPDTYRFPRRTDAATVVATMLARFRHVLATHFRDEIAADRGQLHEVVTLASLVEKETPDPTERAMVAGVFTRRLEKGMLLQCDPTVVYAARIAHHPIGVITTKDLNFDSPFNTYRHAGLPPGPIASPGEAAIRAAFHPAIGDTLYFVSNNHGGHLFSRSLAEHQRKVARYKQEVAASQHKALATPKTSVPSATPMRHTQSPKAGGPSKSVSPGQQKADPS
jgi:UPF0755 protein